MSPVDAVRASDPYPYYASLVAERPFAFDDDLGLWVAAGARATTTVLTDPALRVRPPEAPVPPGIVGTPAGDVFGDLVRMTDGEPHDRLKEVVTAALGRVDHATVSKLAADRAARTDRLDELMFDVPAQVVAALCGLDDGHSAEAARLVGDFVRCLPATATPEDLTAAAEAAAALRDLMGPALDRRSNSLLGDLVRAAERAGRHETAPLLANGIGFLSQTYDATAGLIGNTLLALARRPAPADLTAFVNEVVRHDAPVHNTRRFAVAPFRFGDTEVAAGQSVLAVVAAANRDPEVNPDPHEFRTDRADPVVFTFGAGPHGCPGQALAVAITVGVLDEWLTNGFDPAGLPDQVTYRPLPNIRIPDLPPKP